MMCFLQYVDRLSLVTLYIMIQRAESGRNQNSSQNRRSHIAGLLTRFWTELNQSTYGSIVCTLTRHLRRSWKDNIRRNWKVNNWIIRMIQEIIDRSVFSALASVVSDYWGIEPNVGESSSVRVWPSGWAVNMKSVIVYFVMTLVWFLTETDLSIITLTVSRYQVFVHWSRY